MYSTHNVYVRLYVYVPQYLYVCKEPRVFQVYFWMIIRLDIDRSHRSRPGWKMKFPFPQFLVSALFFLFLFLFFFLFSIISFYFHFWCFFNSFLFIPQLKIWWWEIVILILHDIKFDLKLQNTLHILLQEIVIKSETCNLKLQNTLHILLQEIVIKSEIRDLKIQNTLQFYYQKLWLNQKNQFICKLPIDMAAIQFYLWMPW